MGNPTSRGQQRDKPFRDAIRMEEKELAEGNQIEYPKGSLRWNAQQLLVKGSEQSIREIADRLDGKPNQAVEMTHDVTDPLMELLEQVSGKTRGLPSGQ